MPFRLPALLLVATTCLVATGCLNSTTLVKLRPDGSGTIEQSVLVNAAMAQSLAALLGQMTGAQKDADAPPRLPTPSELMDEARLKEAAASFGRGVRLVSSTPIKEGALEGSRAVFAFDDINALSVDQSPGGATRTKRDRVGFKLEKRPNGTSLLTINLPDDVRAGKPAPPGVTAADARQVPPEALAFVRPFLEGLRVAIALDVDGTLVKTNAEHVSGKRITVLDVNFSELLKDPAALEKLSAVGPRAGIGDLRAALEGVPGIKVNTAPTLTVEMR